MFVHRWLVFASVLACGEPAPLQVPQVPATLVLPAVASPRSEADPAVNLSGSGSLYVGAFNLNESFGTMEVMGRTLPAVVIARGTLPGRQTILHEIYAVADDGFLLIWTYCDAGVVDQIYLEDPKGIWTRNGIEASGTCAEVRRTSFAEVNLPASEMAWPRVYDGFEVNGESIQLPPGRPGAVRFDGVVQAVFTFATVDCSLCGGEGWNELHAVLWNPITGRQTLGIFYLEPQDRAHVTLDYAIDLATLTPIPPETYTADWSFTGIVLPATL